MIHILAGHISESLAIIKYGKKSNNKRGALWKGGQEHEELLEEEKGPSNIAI